MDKGNVYIQSRLLFISKEERSYVISMRTDGTADHNVKQNNSD
jgi:hypothetical protein